MERRRLTLVDGHPTSEAGWIYVWLWGGLVRYIGATWLDPAARIEAHLHADTEDPRSLALRAAVESESDSPVIHAFAVLAGADRQAFRRAVVQGCAEAGLLGSAFLGAGDGEVLTEGSDQAWLRQVVDELRAASRAEQGSAS